MQQQLAAMQGGNQQQNAQQYNQMYRSWRQTMHQQSGKQGQQAPNDDLKNFYIKVALNKESIKAVGHLASHGSICMHVSQDLTI